MSNYTKTTDFEAKDSLPTGDSGKIIRGAEFETEFDAISTAIATKADTAGPTFTGTLTFETISDGTIGVTAFVDEDNMASNSATLVPTQQSVKAYVDSVTTELEAQDLDFQADSGGALSIDLDTETMTFTGGTGIDTTGALNEVTFAIDSTVATLTGTQTLTNKTLTAPTISGNLTTDGNIDGRDVATDGAKLDGIEAGATADQTDAEIRAAVEAATDSNVFTDADHTKLDGIEASATADQTDAEIRAAVEAATDSNVFTDADHTKLDGIEANATADQTDAEIRAAVEAATDSNVFTDADHTKLDGIEALADVTDTTNVTAAGAVMDTELTDITAVKSLDQGVATTDTPTFAGLTTTGDVTFGDNDKAIFGAGSDLQIYHDGSHSYVKDNGTGNLRLQGSTTVQITDPSFTSYSAQFNPTGAATLYHNNSAKLATTATGIDVTGTIVGDGLNVDAGSFVINTSGASLITSTGSVKIDIDSDNNATDNRFLITSDGNTNNRLQIRENGDFSLFEDTGTTAKLFWDASAENLTITGVKDTSSLILASNLTTVGGGALADYNQLYFDNTGGSGDAFIRHYANTHNDSNSALTFGTAISGTVAERMRIDSNGNVGIGTSSPEAALTVTPESGNFNGTYNSYDGVGLFIRGNGTAGSGNYGSALVFGSVDSDGANQENKHSAISMVQTGNDANQAGLAFWIHKTDASTDNLEEAMRINSSGNVGIGTDSPSQEFHLRQASGDCNLLIDSANGASQIFFGDDESVNIGNIRYDHASNYMRFSTNSAEAMRIDSSGNLLVGTTSLTTTTAGIKLDADGDIAANRDGDAAAFFGRLTSDGEIVRFRKDGSTVGSIGTGGGDLNIGTGDTRIRFNDATDNIIPLNAGNGYRDAAISIGDSTARFKDLWLSGGAYLGGVGSANHLDDYEEGTWTGTLTGSSTAPSTAQTATGTYTKVGNLVTVNIGFSNKDNTGASGNAQITGLPFTCGDNVQGAGWNSRVGSSTDVKMAYIGSDNNIVWVNGHGSSLAWTTTGTGTYAGVTITFMVA